MSSLADRYSRQILRLCVAETVLNLQGQSTRIDGYFPYAQECER
jgi:hypothetical protein